MWTLKFNFKLNVQLPVYKTKTLDPFNLKFNLIIWTINCWQSSDYYAQWYWWQWHRQGYCWQTKWLVLLVVVVGVVSASGISDWSRMQVAWTLTQDSTSRGGPWQGPPLMSQLLYAEWLKNLKSAVRLVTRVYYSITGFIIIMIIFRLS